MSLDLGNPIYKVTWKDQQRLRRALAVEGNRHLRMAPLAYSQKRAFDTDKEDPKELDCSALTERCYKFIGYPLFPTWGYGNTWTQSAVGKRVSVPALGDLVFYKDPDHVGIVVRLGPRTLQAVKRLLRLGGVMVVQHGSAGGPRLSVISYREIYQIRRYIVVGRKK